MEKRVLREFREMLFGRIMENKEFGDYTPFFIRWYILNPAIGSNKIDRYWKERSIVNLIPFKELDLIVYLLKHGADVHYARELFMNKNWKKEIFPRVLLK